MILWWIIRKSCNTLQEQINGGSMRAKSMCMTTYGIMMTGHQPPRAPWVTGIHGHIAWHWKLPVQAQQKYSASMEHLRQWSIISRWADCRWLWTTIPALYHYTGANPFIRNHDIHWHRLWSVSIDVLACRQSVPGTMAPHIITNAVYYLSYHIILYHVFELKIVISFRWSTQAKL